VNRAPAVSRPTSPLPAMRNGVNTVHNPLANGRPVSRDARVTERATAKAEPSPAQVQAQNDVNVRRAEVARQTTPTQRTFATQRLNTAEQTLRARQAATATQNAITAQRNSNTREALATRRAAELRGDFDHREWDRNREQSWHQYRYYNAPDWAYRGWDRGRVYAWNNHRYHWFGGSWVLIDPGYDYGYDTGAYVDNSTTLAPVGANLVAEVQFELQRAGYDPGPADGVFGSHTQDAVARYQADHGLAVTGRINPPLLASLGIQS
jgi:hypothetical protein